MQAVALSLFFKSLKLLCGRVDAPKEQWVQNTDFAVQPNPKMDIVLLGFSDTAGTTLSAQKQCPSIWNL